MFCRGHNTSNSFLSRPLLPSLSRRLKRVPLPVDVFCFSSGSAVVVVVVVVVDVVVVVVVVDVVVVVVVFPLFVVIVVDVIVVCVLVVSSSSSSPSCTGWMPKSQLDMVSTFSCSECLMFWACRSALVSANGPDAPEQEAVPASQLCESAVASARLQNP